MADDGLRFEAWSMPHVGVLAKKFDFTKWIESYDLNDRFSDLSDGTLTLTDDFPLRDSLFKIDEANHLNDVGSMVRVLRGTTPIMHFIVTRLARSWSDEEPRWTVTLEGLEWLLDKALVPHFDHPADPTIDPDFIYGADSVLANGGLEQSPKTNPTWQLYTTATAGTFTASDTVDTTSAIAFNADFGTLANELELDLGLIDDVVVSGAGTAAVPWSIELVAPNDVDRTLTVNGAGLTPVNSHVLTKTLTGGVPQLAYWTKSFHPQTGQLHGIYTTFEVSTEQNHTTGGTYSLKVVGTTPAGFEDFAGAQQIVSVTPGKTWRAAAWVRPTATGRFRMVIRTLDETFIAQVEASLTLNVWTQLVVAPFVVPAHIDQVIVRVASIEVSAQPAWYLDDAELAPGKPAAKLGLMLSDVRTACLAQGTLGWLTPTWTTTLDSDAATWDLDRKWSVTHDQSILQLEEYVAKQNYEWRIRWDVADNRFEWDQWNPNGGGQTRTVAVTGKSGVSAASPLTKRPPPATYVRTEGPNGRWGEHASTTLDDVWGRLEKAVPDRQGLDSADLDIFAQRLVTTGEAHTATRSIRAEDPVHLPWTAYEPGDLVTVVLDEKKVVRVSAIVASMSPGQAVPAYDVHFGAPVLSNEAALAQGLRTVLRELKAAQSSPPAGLSVQVPTGVGTHLNVYSFPGNVFAEAGALRLLFSTFTTLIGIRVAVNTAPTGASIICDANKNGQTVFTDQTTRPTIVAGAFSSSEAKPQVTNFAPGDYITVDVDAVGSTIPGGHLTVMVRTQGAAV